MSCFTDKKPPSVAAGVGAKHAHAGRRHCIVSIASKHRSQQGLARLPLPKALFVKNCGIGIDAGSQRWLHCGAMSIASADAGIPLGSASPLPVAGRNFITALVHTARLIHDPQRLMDDLVAAHGDTFVMSLLDGPCLVTGRPEFLKEIFAADPSLFFPRADIVAPFVGEQSIVMSYGDVHRRKRKLMTPPFHGARLRSYGQIIQDAAWRASADMIVGAKQSILDVTQALSLDVIVRAIFGIQGDAQIAAFQRLIQANIESFPAWLMFSKPLHRRFFGLGPWERHLRSVARLEKVLLDEIARRRRELDAQKEREDVLALLLAVRDENGEPMEDRELLDELRTLVLAGHETTATTLGWALYEVHRHPQVRKTLLAELQPLGNRPDPDSLSKLPYLAAVCDEVLRLHPVVPILRRQLTRPWQLGDYSLPAFTLLAPAIMIAQQNPTLYPNPQAFIPQRFIDRSFGPHEYMPFGGGSRRCIGAAFSRYELSIALGSLLARHSFALISQKEVSARLNGVTTRPRSDIALRYDGMRHSKLYARR